MYSWIYVLGGLFSFISWYRERNFRKKRKLIKLNGEFQASKIAVVTKGRVKIHDEDS